MTNDDAARTSDSAGLVPDTKDWTWVLDKRCPECGANVREIAPQEIAGLIPELVSRWREVLAGHDVASRPRPGVWSPLEYACHARDVFGVFAQRTQLILDEDNPTFEDWNQDTAAVVGRYGAQEPGEVARDLSAAAGALASLLSQVPDGAWDRRGLRSNGSAFTLGTLTQYLLHDVLHHLADVDG